MSWFNPFEGKTNGGGGGTTDYEALQNKPQINGIMLSGDLSTSDLHIDIPTTAADVGALPSTTKYAASIDLSINSSNYIMTAQLKDQDGNNIGSSDSIDLPLETMVIGGQYDDETKKIVLTLKSGDTVEFSIADLVSGLQAEITSENKLSADLIQDGDTNKVVSSSEKSTWNGKQNAITAQAKLSADLIQDGNTNKIVTASEKTSWGNKQNAITSESKLSSDLVDDANNTHLFVSASEKNTWNGKASAADQAIDRAALVELVDGGAKNLSNWYTGTAAIDGTTIATAVPITYQSGDFVFSYDTSLTTGSITIGFRDENNTLINSVQVDNVTKVKIAAIPVGSARFNVYASKAGTYSNFMICSKAAWDVSHAFQPYRPTYQELYEMVQALQPQP